MILGYSDLGVILESFWIKGLIIRKHHVHKPIECQEIRQNHLTVKLGHSDLQINWGQRFGPTHS